MGFYDKYREEIDIIKKYLFRGSIILILVLLISGIIKNTPAGYVGVVYNYFAGGLQLKEFNNGEEGLGYKFPLIQTVVYIPTTIQSVQLGGDWAKDKNGLSFGWDITIRYKIDPTQAAELLKIYGNNHERMLSSNLISISTELFSSYPQQNLSHNTTYFSEIFKKELQEKINTEITESLKPDSIIIYSVDLGQLRYNQEIEAFLQNNERRKDMEQAQRFNLEEAKLINEKIIIETETAKKKAELEAETVANVEKIKVDHATYTIQQEANAKAEAIRKIADAYRDVPPSYILAKAYESIKQNDKIIVGIDSLTDPEKLGVTYKELINLLNQTEPR